MSAPTPPTKMTYRFLGDSGLLVSKLALGSWMNADPVNHTAGAWFEMMKTAFSHGINFFDTAESYNGGRSETLMGAAIQRGITESLWQREDLVISTKLFGGNTGGVCKPNGHGLSRKHLIEGARSSLKKLQLEYVDVLFCHRWEPYTPMEEVVRAMNFIISQGWALYWGTSEWNASEIRKACDIADRLGLVRPIVEQPQYNLLERSKVEFEFADLYKQYNLGLTVWSPLASGILTGKYAAGVVPEGSRLAHPVFRALIPDFEEWTTKAQGLERIADGLDCSLAQLAIAWCMSNEHVSTVLLGARTPSQLEETIRALGVVEKLTSEVKAEIDATVGFVPKLLGPDWISTSRKAHLTGEGVTGSVWVLKKQD